MWLHSWKMEYDACKHTWFYANFYSNLPFTQQSGFLRHYPTGKLSQSLTFSLDLKHADGILRVERPHLAGRERVSPLHPRGNRRWRLHWFDEWLRANNGHHTTLLSPLQIKTSPLLSPARQDHLCRALRAQQEGLCVYL